jgi:hypothetical protein
VRGDAKVPCELFEYSFVSPIPRQPQLNGVLPNGTSPHTVDRAVRWDVIAAVSRQTSRVLDEAPFRLLLSLDIEITSFA